ncbi:MAG: O-antigen polymerase [Gemmataceae bacterium]
MYTSVHDNLAFWMLWLATLLVCTHQMIRSMRSPITILGFVPVVCTMFGYVYVVQAAGVATALSHRIRPDYLALGQLVVLASLIGLLYGWHLGCGRLGAPPPVRLNPARSRTLWYFGVGAMMIGIAGQYSFLSIYGNEFSASAYFYLLFHVAYPGLAICVYIASSDPDYRQGNNVLLLLALSFLLMVPYVYSVRRGPTFTFIVVAVYSFYLARPRRVNRGVILGGLLAAGVTMLLFVTIRDYSNTGAWGSWGSDRFQNATIDNVLLKKAYEEDDNEFLYNCCIIATCYELDRWQWGTSYLSLMSHWIPRQWWPDKPKLATGWFDPPTWDELYDVTGVKPTLGSTYSCVGEAFQDFSWFAPLFWFAIGQIYGRFFRLAVRHPSSVFPFLYIGLIACSHWLISQGFAAAFVPAVCYLAVPIAIFAVTGNLKFRALATSTLRRPVGVRQPTAI